MFSRETYKQIITGERRGAVASVSRGALRAASVIYKGVTAGRNLCFHKGLRRAKKVFVPVISVGNLTTGGTGKTPLVATVVQQLRQLERKPGIVSRGYRADRNGINDEKRVLERLCPGVHHVQNPDRIEAASELINDHQVDSIVLDDGFQHRRIARDLDIVLIDAKNPFGYGFILPRGLLRESIRGLRRADVVVITRCDQVSIIQLTGIEDRICRIAPQHRDRIVQVSFRPVGLLGADGTKPELSRLEKCRVMVLAAIGNPEGFEGTCRRAGAIVIRSRFFPDHYHYTRSDLRAVQSEAAKHRVDAVLTTVKDMVKIQRLGPDGVQAVPVLALEIATVFDSPNGEHLLRSLVSGAMS